MVIKININNGILILACVNFDFFCTKIQFKLLYQYIKYGTYTLIYLVEKISPVKINVWKK